MNKWQITSDLKSTWYVTCIISSINKCQLHTTYTLKQTSLLKHVSQLLNTGTAQKTCQNSKLRISSTNKLMRLQDMVSN